LPFQSAVCRVALDLQQSEESNENKPASPSLKAYNVDRVVKKKYPVSKKARSATGWHKHLRKDGKRAANKSTRKIFQTARP